MENTLTSSTEPNSRRVLDSLGIALSMLCIAHCLVLPLVVALLPFAIGEQLSQPWVHWGLLATVLPVAAYALYRGYSEHDEALVLVLGAIGLVGLMSAHPTAHALGSHSWETVITVMGGVLLTAAHGRNLWACRVSEQECACDAKDRPRTGS
jgi:hypothetical protein